VDLAKAFDRKPTPCFTERNQLYFVQEGKKYLFNDQGFDNSHDYQYQSNNINSYKDKKVQQLHILGKSIKAASESFTFSASINGSDWQEVAGDSLTFSNKGSDQLFLRLQFQPGDDFYSPWFGGLENVFYIAID